MPEETRTLSERLVSLLVERRLPWRVSQWPYRQRLDAMRRSYDHRALSTRPFGNGKECPSFEVHALLGHRHVGMCLWSVKSFLHSSGGAYSVVLHDDGSLTRHDGDILRAHLIDAWIAREGDADEAIRGTIGAFPNCCDYRFGHTLTTDHRGGDYDSNVFALRLFDFNLLSDARKILVVDVDVLYLKEPREIVAWAQDASSTGSPRSVEQYVPRWNAKYEVVGLDRREPAPGWGKAGLLCFDKSAFSLEAIEGWIARDKDLIDKHPTFDQRLYNLLLQRGGDSALLPDSYSFNYIDEDAVATHFAIKHHFFDNVPKLQEALSRSP